MFLELLIRFDDAVWRRSVALTEPTDTLWLHSDALVWDPGSSYLPFCRREREMEAGRRSDGDGQGLLNEVRLLRSKRRNTL